MKENEFKKGTINDTTMDIEPNVPKIADEPLAHKTIAKTRTSDKFKPLTDNIRIPKLSRIENAIGMDLSKPKIPISSYIEDFISSGQGNLKSIRRKVDLLTRLQIGGMSADAHQTRVEKFRELLAVNRTSALFGLLQHSSSVQVPYYKKSLALAYNHGQLIKKLTASVNVLGQVLESKLEAIKLNTSAPDANKTTLFERISTEMRSRQARMIVDNTVGLLTNSVKSELGKILFADSSNKYAYGTRIKDRIKQLGERIVQKINGKSGDTDEKEDKSKFSLPQVKQTIVSKVNVAQDYLKQKASPIKNIITNTEKNNGYRNTVHDSNDSGGNSSASSGSAPGLKSFLSNLNPFKRLSKNSKSTETSSTPVSSIQKETPVVEKTSTKPKSSTFSIFGNSLKRLKEKAQNFANERLTKSAPLFSSGKVSESGESTPAESRTTAVKPSIFKSGFTQKLSSLFDHSKPAKETVKTPVAEKAKPVEKEDKSSQLIGKPVGTPSVHKRSIEHVVKHNTIRNTIEDKYKQLRAESKKKYDEMNAATLKRLREVTKAHSFKAATGKPLDNKPKTEQTASSSSGSGLGLLGKGLGYAAEAIGGILTGKAGASLLGKIFPSSGKRGFFKNITTRLKVGNYLRNKLGSRFYKRLGKDVANTAIKSGESIIKHGLSATKPLMSGVGNTVFSKPLAKVSKYLGKGALRVGKDVSKVGMTGVKYGVTKIAPKFLKKYAKANISTAKLAGRGLLKASKVAVPFAAGFAGETAKLAGKGVWNLGKNLLVKPLTKIPEGLSAVGGKFIKSGNKILSSKAASKGLTKLPLKTVGTLTRGVGSVLKTPKAIKTLSEMGGQLFDKGVAKTALLGAGKAGISGSVLRGVGKAGAGVLKFGKGVLSPAALGGMAMTAAADHLTTEGSFTNHALRTGGSALTWGATGAALGSIIPGIGTAAGAVIGAGAGALVENMKYVKQVGHYLYNSVVGTDTKIDPNTGKVLKRGKHGLVNNMYTTIFGRKAKMGPNGEPEPPKYGILERLSDFVTFSDKYKKKFETETREYNKVKEKLRLDRSKWDLSKSDKGTELKMTDPFTGAPITEQFEIPKGSIVNNDSITTTPEYKSLFSKLPKELQDKAPTDKPLQYLIYAVSRNSKDQKAALDLINKNFIAGESSDTLARKVFDQMSVEAINSKDKDRMDKLAKISSIKDYAQGLSSGDIAVPTITSANTSFGIKPASTGDDSGIDTSSIPKAKTSKNLKSNQAELIKALVNNEHVPLKNAQVLAANVSGESLVDPSDTSGDHHRAQGIAQWHPDRSLPIKKRFGKFPYQMSIAEQAHAMMWEMQNNRMYHESFKAMYDPNVSQESLISTLVNNYERPKDRTGAIRTRIGFLKSITDNRELSKAPAMGTKQQDGSSMYAANDNKSKAGTSSTPTVEKTQDNSKTGNQPSSNVMKTPVVGKSASPFTSTDMVNSGTASYSALTKEVSSKYTQPTVNAPKPQVISSPTPVEIPKLPEFPDIINPKVHENLLSSINSNNMNMAAKQDKTNQLLEQLLSVSATGVNQSIKNSNNKNAVSPDKPVTPSRNRITQNGGATADLDISKKMRASG